MILIIIRAFKFYAFDILQNAEYLGNSSILRLFVSSDALKPASEF